MPQQNTSYLCTKGFIQSAGLWSKGVIRLCIIKVKPMVYIKFHVLFIILTFLLEKLKICLSLVIMIHTFVISAHQGLYKVLQSIYCEHCKHNKCCKLIETTCSFNKLQFTICIQY